MIYVTILVIHNIVHRFKIFIWFLTEIMKLIMIYWLFTNIGIWMFCGLHTSVFIINNLILEKHTKYLVKKCKKILI